MKPYWSDSTCTIWHGDCREVFPLLGKMDIVLTDPPFAEQTHSGARTGSADRKLVEFDSITSDELVAFLQLTRQLCNGWQISFVDWRHMLALESLDFDLELVRFGVWVKPNGMPQYSGDRPATGWEAIAFLHPQGKKKWNGGGRSSVFTCNFEQDGRVHPTQKPIQLVGELLNLFAKPSDTVLDPFMGSGTTLVAAKARGLRAVGIELDEAFCEAAANRLAQEVLPL